MNTYQYPVHDFYEYLMSCFMGNMTKKSSLHTSAVNRALKVLSLDTLGYLIMISAFAVSREECKSLNSLVSSSQQKYPYQL